VRSSDPSLIGAIFDGRITYSSSSFIDILGDKWKSKQIELYDVYLAARTKARASMSCRWDERAAENDTHGLEAGSDVDRHSRYEHIPVSRLSAIEIWFFIYSIGYSVDKLEDEGRKEDEKVAEFDHRAVLGCKDKSQGVNEL
jgi:hypothetical protein